MEKTERKTVQFKGKGEPGLCSEVSLLYRSHAARPWHGYQILTGTFLKTARALAINSSCFYTKEMEIPEN